MPSRGDFFNLYRHGFVRVAVATPRVRIGDPRHNADATLELMQQAARDKALLAVFPVAEMPAFVLHVEICEDLWVPAPPSSFAALAGASVIGNLSASNIIIGKEGYRHQLAANQSARCLAAYLYSAAGIGESTTDLAWDGHAIIYENGTLLAESQRFAAAPQLALADVDLDRLLADRMRQNTFAEGARRHPAEVARFRSVEFSLPLPRGRLPLERRIGRFPYVPGDAASRVLRREEG